MSHIRWLFVAVLAIAAAGSFACRSDPSETERTDTGQFGGPGDDFTCQCSGWFPDWISANPPPANVESFQLAQGYPLGLPVVKTVAGVSKIVGWEPFDAATVGPAAPWLAFDFHSASQRADYLDALKNYALEGMPEVDFVAQENPHRRWYHVPMMTTSPTSRREPYHGTTKERALRADEHSWIAANQSLDSFAIGYYNVLGGYTIGQVFHDVDPGLADPSKADFIDGAFVFKLIFAEYDPSQIVAALDPLVGAPEWQVQDVGAPTAPLKNVRLIQLDIAVKDPRAAQTGWVFATYAYDKSLAAEPVQWRRLTAVGLQWGNDPDVTGPGVGTLNESWTNESALPAVFQGHLGRDGRLNGPVDNPASSCLSCHSTAQVVVGATSLSAFRGARLFPPGGCSNVQDMTWFRNIAGGTPFGVMNNSGNGCATASTPLAIHSMDYSLQLADALESALFRGNPNPCAASALAALAAAAAPGDERSEQRNRMLLPRASRVRLDESVMKRLRSQEPAQVTR
ncbi:MAG: hypothetical protein ACKVWV_10020 [Planctomycetota bacterium]